MRRIVDDEGQRRTVTGKGLYRDENQLSGWRPLVVEHYDAASKLFTCRYRFNRQETQLERINICLDAEDPKKFAKRIAFAFD